MSMEQSAPWAPNYNAITKVVTAPSVPADAVKASVPIVYIHTLAGAGMIREICIAEADNTSPGITHK